MEDPICLLATVRTLKFIWNGGNDRVKRDISCNDYEHGGLRMFDLQLFSYAQKINLG